MKVLNLFCGVDRVNGATAADILNVPNLSYYLLLAHRLILYHTTANRSAIVIKKRMQVSLCRGIFWYPCKPTKNSRKNSLPFIT